MSENEKIEKGYQPKDVEPKWYSFWVKNRYFTPTGDASKKPFSVVIPPPNVTGVLHMGHALNCTIQDIMVRYKRMSGYDALWIPGMDHAGISTQIVVEKQLTQQGIKKEKLGRDEFLKKVWEWKEKSGGAILEQQKRLGISVDWSKSKFTLDEDMSAAVKKVFVDLYKDGLIYRGNRLVNWCPRCQTAVSDLEVKHQDTKGTLWHIQYPSSFASPVVVATTRPETLLGDVALAVNPKDSRYTSLVGKEVQLPLTKRKIKVIADDSVEQEFGSGIVKITPAHDFNDYETGQRHQLPLISIFDKRGVVNDAGGVYQGLKSIEARKKVLEDLTNQGLLIKEEPHPMSVGKCDRCETVIEPMISDQWFVKIKPLADEAIKVVESGEIKFYPENWTKTYLDWLYNIKDWCISRQLWWGHRIPAWYCGSCKKINVQMDVPTKCEFCGGVDLLQDEDVLDTWFSSWLWPLNTMGWPKSTPLLNRYFPTSLLVTGFDIIFFWVARMIMASLYFKKSIPFKDIYIHALVRDERGQKMSKSKGNAVDPLDLVADYGTDSLRFTLASLVGAGRDIRFSEERLDGYKNFINKIWNAARFAMGAIKDVVPANENEVRGGELTLSDRYIVQELKTAVEEVTLALEQYRFTDAANSLYRFTWNEFCDWYLEMSKPVLYGSDPKQKSITAFVLLNALDRILKALHPFIPFVTEEIYHLLPKHGESLCVEQYPKVTDAFFDFGTAQAAHDVAVIKAVVSSVRNIRGENRISPAVKLNFTIAAEGQLLEILKQNDNFIKSLSRAQEIRYSSQVQDTKRAAVSLLTLGEQRISIVVPLEGLVDFNEELKRLRKEIDKIQKDLDLTQGKLQRETFIKNAPIEIVEQEKTRLAQLLDKKAHVETQIERLQ